MDPTTSATKTGQVFDWAVLRRLLGYVRPHQGSAFLSGSQFINYASRRIDYALIL